MEHSDFVINFLSQELVKKEVIIASLMAQLQDTKEQASKAELRKIFKAQEKKGEEADNGK